MDEVVQAERSVAKHVRGDATPELISSKPAGREAEPDDKHRGIPIPGAVTKKRSRRRSCGLDMDSDAVLDELAAAEGGFNKDWQCHRAVTSL
jgi:hypothetical protein